MQSNYAKIIRDNLSRAFSVDPVHLERRLGAQRKGTCIVFRALGKVCALTRDGIFLDGEPEQGPLGIVISLYALHATDEPIELEPFKAFKDFPNSMPYQGAFKANTEAPLIPYVEKIKECREIILERFNGHEASAQLRGDMAFVLYPLPKVALAYIFYLPDEEFPASAICLFSNNALCFLPLDGLADLGEYTSKAIVDLVTNHSKSGRNVS